MDHAMRGKIERGLVELITNADDSYSDLEEQGVKTSGKIRIEIERRRTDKPSLVIVRDRAGGMSKSDLHDKLGQLGVRASGFEKGKARRGLLGRGAKDLAAFGTVHFESIKDGYYNHLVLSRSLECRFENEYPQKATDKLRNFLGIPRGNGTVVSVEVDNKIPIPHHETLVSDFSRYYSLRDIFSNSKRQVTIVDLNKPRENPLNYKYPEGKIIFDDFLKMSEYPEAKAKLILKIHEECFENQPLPYRQGILIKSGAAIHDCSYFRLDNSEPLVWHFTGELKCSYIDTLILEYDDREEANPENPRHPENNNTRILNPARDGLVEDHPFVKALNKAGKKTLRKFIEDLKQKEKSSERKVANENLYKKLKNLSREISKIFKDKLQELNEEIDYTDFDNDEEELGIGLHIIPNSPGKPFTIYRNEPKTFSIIIKDSEPLDESLPIIFEQINNNVKIEKTPVFIKKLSEDKKIGKSSFTVLGEESKKEDLIDVIYNGFRDDLHIKVSSKSKEENIIPNGLSFEREEYKIPFNKDKKIILRLKIEKSKLSEYDAKITSDKPSEIVVKGGGRCILKKTKEANVFRGHIKVTGRRLNARGLLTAEIDTETNNNYKTTAQISIVEREVKSGLKFDFKPVEEDYRSLRYRWDVDKPYFLYIGAKHPSIRKYLGAPTEDEYPGIDSEQYHVVLAEVIAEAMAFKTLESVFRREGQAGQLDYASLDSYYHKHFSDYLNVTHKYLGEFAKEKL